MSFDLSRPSSVVLVVRVIAFACGLTTGCRAGRGEPAGAPARPAPRPTHTSGTPVPSSSLSSPVSGGLTLAERLAHEARERPSAALRPEDARASFARAGLVLAGWQQVLASTVGASFCMAGHTAHGTAVALCEYPDEAAAARGLSASRATFDRLIPGRQLVVKHATLLTLAPVPGDADGARESAALQRTFVSL